MEESLLYIIVGAIMTLAGAILVFGKPTAHTVITLLGYGLLVIGIVVLIIGFILFAN